MGGKCSKHGVDVKYVQDLSGETGSDRQRVVA
jgi:hypothetical protein